MGAVPSRILVREHGPHLTLTASEDIRANGHGGPATAISGEWRAHEQFQRMNNAEKDALRTAMRQRRAAFARDHSGAISAPEALLTRLAGGRIVAGYIPLSGEADPRAIIEAAFALGCTIALPHVLGPRTSLRFISWQPGDALYAGPFGLKQPDPAGAEVAPDIILAPLVAFDRDLNRLGQGAGHYDHAFAANGSAWRVGIAWSVQEVPALATDPWDVPLHAVITEKEWILPQ